MVKWVAKRPVESRLPCARKREMNNMFFWCYSRWMLSCPGSFPCVIQSRRRSQEHDIFTTLTVWSKFCLTRENELFNPVFHALDNQHIFPLLTDGECQVVLAFSEVGNESRTPCFPYINRLVKFPFKERKRIVQPRFPCAGKHELNSIFSWC